MNIMIKHEIPGRIRFSLGRRHLRVDEADMLLYYLLSIEGVSGAKVYDRTGTAAVCYEGSRETLIQRIRQFSFDNEEIRELVPENSGRALNVVYQEKLIMKTVRHYLVRLFLPAPIRTVRTVLMSIRFIKEGLTCLMKRRIEVPVLDATAITVSLLRRDFGTASSVMFLLGIGELLEEWTHKKSVADLARSMSLGSGKVWLKREGTEVLVPVQDIQEGDIIAVHMGSVIPLDGIVTGGEALVNQASLTGEAIPVRKESGAYVYAGTALEEGDLEICIRKASGTTRYEKIVEMIEASERLKSSLESKAEHLADRLVPYSLLGTVAAYALTRNVTKALSILMVDFSCALKLSMPVAVLSAMRECQEHNLTVKGGRFLEAVAEADTLVFDKTGTLTKACPTVADIVTFDGHGVDDMLRLAACLEEHFPHSIANAVVNEAERRGLKHAEMHSKVAYVVAHGIASTVENEKAVIGSAHFVFEDEKCVIPPEEQAKFDGISKEYSHLYLALSGRLAAVICIEDPLRPEAKEVIRQLHQKGFDNIVMMTGDNRHTAEAVAQQVGVDTFHAEVLPEDKAAYVEEAKAEGHKVVMIGDGINDSPALSAADVGIAISEGAQLAREIADITISENNLYQLVTLKEISDALMKRIHTNYRQVIGFNLGLIALGLAGVIAPSTSALLHNASTLAIGMKSMTNLLPEETQEEEKTNQR